MAYMKRNVNFGFFLLLIATLLSLAGLSIYYQTTFKDLYTDYKLKLDDLTNISSTLSSERTRLNQTSYQLMVKQEREKELSTQYTGLRTEKEKIEAEKESLQKQLTTKKAELKQGRAELFTAQQNLKTTKTDLADAMTTISGLRVDIVDLNKDLVNLTAELAKCTCP